MTDTINKIIKKLENYPDCDYELNDSSIILKPVDKDGFTVSLTVNRHNNYTVAYDYWHEEFENEDEALNCFAFGLSSECRLKITKRGNRAYKWTVEYKDSDNWKTDSTTGLFNFVFWKRKKIEYLQNDLINDK